MLVGKNQTRYFKLLILRKHCWVHTFDLIYLDRYLFRSFFDCTSGLLGFPELFLVEKLVKTLNQHPREQKVNYIRQNELMRKILIFFFFGGVFFGFLYTDSEEFEC